jgi:hypothetical protein
VPEFFGWAQIARRLSVSIPTARRWHVDLGLLVYQRRRPHGRQTWTWYTNDSLIHAWEVSRALVDRRDMLAQRKQRASRTAAETGRER